MKTLQNWLLSRLFNTIVLDDIITTVNGKIVMLDGNPVTEEELGTLSNEAKVIQSTRVYRIMINTLRLQSQRKMFEDSKSWEDMIAGKMMLHSIGVIENIIKLLSK